MKTKELIKRLQEADPSGELECCVGNADIYFCHVEPAYWDGCLQVLKRDPKLEPYYNLTGVKFTTKGNKVQIEVVDFETLLLDVEDAEVEYEGEEWVRRTYEPQVNHYREEARKIKEWCNKPEEKKDVESGDEHKSDS